MSATICTCIRRAQPLGQTAKERSVWSLPPAGTPGDKVERLLSTECITSWEEAIPRM